MVDLVYAHQNVYDLILAGAHAELEATWHVCPLGALVWLRMWLWTGKNLLHHSDGILVFKS